MYAYKMFGGLVIILNFMYVIGDGDYLFPNLPLGVPNANGKTCNNDNQLFVSSLKNLSMWAYQMYDASGKSPSGRLDGNMYDLGNLKECIYVEGPFTTQYCLVTISANNIPEPNPPRDPKSLIYEATESVLRKLYVKDDVYQQRRDIVQLGWCVPSSCDPSDLEGSLNQYLRDEDNILKEHNVTFSGVVVKQLCQTKHPEELGNLELSFCIITAVIISVITLATFLDYNDRKYQIANKNKFVNIFSAIKSFNELSSANYDKGLGVLNGIKIGSFLFVLVGHVMCLSLVMPIRNFGYLEEASRTDFIKLFINGSIFVDGFFITAGFLLGYKMINERGLLKNPLNWIFLRYISLTPSYAFVIFFYVAMLQRLGSGPLWNVIVLPEVKKCADNWWTNLLYIGNYYKSDELCILQSWYLNCDFHFFLVALILLYLHRKNKVVGLFLAGVTLLISILVPAITYYVDNLRLINSAAVGDMTNLPQSKNFIYGYIKSHNRAAPYFIGLLGGYIYKNMKQNNKKLTRLQSNILYLVSSACLMFGLFSGYYFVQVSYEYSALLESSWMSLHRVLWAAGNIGLIIAVNFGDGLLLRSVLGWQPFVPLGKLVYGAYLSHMILLIRRMGIVGESMTVDMINIWATLLGYMALSFFLSLLLYITIEAPIKNVYRELFSPPKKPDERTHI